MRTAVGLVFVGAMAIGTTAPVMAQGIYFGAPGVHVYLGHHPHYYNYYGGGGWNTASGCQPGWTVQGGICKPYHYGPWDYYGGTHQDWGYR